MRLQTSVGSRQDDMEAIAVIHLVQIVLRLEVAQPGIGHIGQRDLCRDSVQIP